MEGQAAMPEQIALTCHKCFAVFQTTKTLQRHMTSHSEEKPYQCSFCKARFKRSDVLRKHYKSCAARQETGEEVPASSRGRSRKACDRCIQLKKGCDGQNPCHVCARSQQTCTYDRMRDAGPSQEPTPLPKLEVELRSEIPMDFYSPAGSNPLSHTDEDTDYDLDNPHLRSSRRTDSSSSSTPWRIDTIAYKFPYLLNVTHSESLQKVFNWGRERPSVIMESDADTEMEATSFLQTNKDTSARLSQNWSTNELPGTTQRTSQPPEEIDDPLFPKSQEIWQMFRAVLPQKPDKNSTYSSGCPETRCQQFFKPSNIRKFLVIYWNEWHPHTPILHKPTFDATKASPLLVAIMVLLAAFMCTSDELHYHAREWLDLHEVLTFSDPFLSVEAAERHPGADDVESLQLLQTAFLTCMLQCWEGSGTAKRRTRQQRFATLVSSTRDLNISTGRHGSHEDEEESLWDWKRFIHKEETIRFFTYVFMLDVFYVIFNNAPPRMIIQEMDIDLTASEECFQAQSAAEWRGLWKQSLEITKGLRYTDTLQLLASPVSTPEIEARFSKMSILNLYVLLAGYHIVLFQQQTLFICLPVSLLPLKMALDRWHVAWAAVQETATENPPQEPWQEPGFIAHGDEYAALAAARLENLQSKNPAAGIVRQYENERLDETSMSQVADLMKKLSTNHPG